MATILRSSKYIRCLNALTRRVIVTNDKANIASKCLTLQAQCINSYLTKSYATSPAIQRLDNVNYDKYLAKLDENVQRYGRVFKHEVEDVLSKVRNTGYIQSLDGLLLIRCCGELLVDTIPETRNQLVQEIWTTLETLKIPMDVSHFNALLRVYLENGYEFSPIEILTKMKDKGIEPNRVTYQRLILYYCKKGDIDGATKILEFMREKNLPLNESVFNALIIGHSEANDMESANKILSVMKDAGVAPCSSTYTALLTAYAKRGDINSIKSIIDECGRKDLYLHDKEFFEVLHVLAANNHDESKIDEILSLMPKGPNYNFDAFHAILKVLDVGNVDVALKILPTMRNRRTLEEESEENENGTFLIRKLVNAKFPVEKIVQACDKLEQQGQHTRAFFIALERSLLNFDVDLSLTLLKACSERGRPIREHFLWPLFAGHGKASNYQGIQDLLKFMTTELKMIPGVETISDYILPYTLGKWDDVVTTLKEFRISHETIVNGIATRMLMDNKIRKTAAFMLSYPANYSCNNIYRPLFDALKATDDSRSFVVITRILHESAINRPTEKTSEEDSADFHNETVIDYAVSRALRALSNRKHAVVDEILDRLIDGGMSLSPEVGQQVREYFGDNLTPETSEKIDKLTSGSLEILPVSKFTAYGPDFDYDDKSMNQQVSMAANNQFAAKRQELSACITAKDAKGVQAVTESLESQNFKFSPAVFAQIIDVFCGAKDLELAERWFNKFKTEHPGIPLDLQKSTNYAALLIRNGRFDDAIQFILDSPRKEQPENQGPGLRRLVKNLLETAAETGDTEKTRKLLDALVTSRYAVIDNYMLGPLVRSHLTRNDLAGALDEFQRACENHKCTPLKNELSKKFIDAEDANSLQRLTDLSTQVHGESNSLVDLVMSFIECGRLRQARKILETPGLRLRSAKFRVAAIRYIDDGKPQFLDQFMEISKGLPVLDRQEVYDVLMDTFDARDDWQRALNLWTEIQEEDTQPSQGFLKTLASLLRRNQKPVPFTDYDKSIDEPVNTGPDYVEDFNAAIQNGNLDRAEAILRNAPGNHPEFSTVMSKLIEEILEKRNDVDKAKELADILITKYSRLPRASALKAVWNALIEAERYRELKELGNQLGTNTKKKYRFQKFLNRAAVKETGLRRFLAEFKSQITDSKKENFALVKEKLHFTTLLNGFKEDPSAISEFLPLAEKLADQQIHLPINVVWCHYFEQNKPEADEIWSKHLANSNWIVFAYLLDSSKTNNNVEIVERLHNLLNENKAVSDNAKATVVAALVDLYNMNERYDDAAKALENTQPEVAHLVTANYENSIVTLKKGLKANGKSLPSNLKVKGS